MLIQLDDTQAQAKYAAAHKMVFALLAKQARLIAERDNAEKINFSTLTANNIDPEISKEILKSEEDQFVSDKESLANSLAILHGRIKQV